PLRDRLADVPELAHYFLFRFDRELGLDVRGFAPEALELLQRYPWPGNVRELQSAVKQAMLHASGHLILPEYLPEEVRRGAAPPPPPAAAPAGLDVEGLIESLLARGEKDLYGKVTEAVERVLLARVLRHTHGHQAQASELLGLNRTTLRHKLRALGLAVDKVLVEDGPPAEG
ncbi:MAG TPA: helix-turn-helix domain-containing protein, partial [Gemmataceae bacterium]|nr:helix-turn-helix domain-containing protein [Gemmataceae bacterium]